MKGKEKIIHKFIEDNIEVIIEMPEIDNESNKKYIEDIKHIMNNEMLLQLNK